MADEKKPSDVYYVAVHDEKNGSLVLENWIEPAMQKVFSKIPIKLTNNIETGQGTQKDAA